jgi:CMP-N-acetylneuraminic acid synthetase
MIQKIVAIIPARGGSKGIPRKNIRLLAGKPLIAYSIEAALNSKYINRVIVTTEDKEIAGISRKYGAEVIERPEGLAKDNSQTIDVVKHILENLKKNENYTPDIIALLQPTSPLRTEKDIDNVIELFANNKCGSVISVCEAIHPVYWTFTIEKYLKPLFSWDYILNKRRQDLPKTYILNGAVYITSLDNLYKYNSFFNRKIIPYIMQSKKSVDIDEKVDFEFVEFLLRRDYGKDKSRK